MVNSRVKVLNPPDRKLRELLWAHHGCSSDCLYGDDG